MSPYLNGRKLFWWLLQGVYWVTWPFRYLYKKAFGYDVFISYSRKDALQYSEKLESALGVTLICYRDEGDASGGRPLREIIDKGVLRSRSIIAIITPESCSSQWVIDELSAFREHLRMCEAKGRRSLSNIFPVFIPPCTPENLPGPLMWLKDHLGCRETDRNVPSHDTIRSIRIAFLGIPKAIKFYGATSLMLLAMTLALAAFAMARMSEARRLWLGAAARAESAGRIDHAELLVAKAVESDVFGHWEDVDFYSKLRQRRMLIPAGCFTLKEESSTRMLLATKLGLCILEEGADSGQLELRGLTKGTTFKLQDAKDYIPHWALLERELFVAAGDMLVSKSIDDEVPPKSLKLPGTCHGIRSIDSEIRLLCESPDGVYLVVVKIKGSTIQSEKILLEGEIRTSDNMLLLSEGKAAVCSVDGGLRLSARYWSRFGKELPSVSWLFADSSIDFPEIVHHDRYIVFQSMRYFPGMDPRNEPDMMAIDLMYPQGVDGGREVQRVAQSAATVKSLNRSKAFAAAIGSGHELRFWDAFNPPLANQYSIPVTDGMSSFETWEFPASTPYYTGEAAVVLVAKDRALEVYAERYVEGARRPAVTMIARYPLEEGFETGRTLVSEDGEYVGVLQWKQDGEKTVNQISLFRRADDSHKDSTQVPSSEELLMELCLKRSEVERQYSPVAVKK